jgi:hypothetical protein
MKVLSAIICLVALPFASVVAQDAQASLQTLDETYGFRGARFETTTSAYKDLVLAEKAGETQYYRRTGEKKQLGSGTLTDVTYGFYKGRLSVVMLKTTGLANSRAVLEALEEQAGPGTRSNPYAQRYAWNASKVHMSYDENALSNDAVILLTCKKLKEQEMKQNLRTRQTEPLGK